MLKVAQDRGIKVPELKVPEPPKNEKAAEVELPEPPKDEKAFAEAKVSVRVRVGLNVRAGVS